MSVQVLTETGSQLLDFNTLPTDCRTAVTLAIVNTGRCVTPLTLGITDRSSSGQHFSFDGGREQSFSLLAAAGGKEGVAKDVAVWVDTGNMEEEVRGSLSRWRERWLCVSGSWCWVQ